MSEVLFCEQIVERKPLTIYADSFECPYCGREWQRGGHKEGFVKSAATRHVFGCWELALFEKGYCLGEYPRGQTGHRAIKVEDMRKLPDGKYIIAALQGLKRRRAAHGPR